MPDLTFDVQELSTLEKAVVVKMSGAIDATTVISFQTTLENLQLNGVTRFILDMEGIRYVNSTGLGSLVRLADQLESEGGGFALVKIHPKVKVVFDMLGLNAFFKIFNSQEDAEAHFGGGSAPAGGAAPKQPAAAAPPAPNQPRAQTQRRPAPPPAQAPSPGTQRRPAPAPGGQMPQTQPMGGNTGMRQAPGAPAAPAFKARAISCQSCGVTLKIAQAGTFKCSRCYTVFTVHPTGQVEFTKAPKPTPLQMNLTCQDECREGLLYFLGAIAKYHQFNQQRIQQLQAAINEVIVHITRDSYGNNPAGTYSVLIAAINNEINLKFADKGRLFPQGTPNMFMTTKQVMQTFDVRPHPQQGNVITLKMTAY